MLHLATHGDFRADNPLFSGLALADGSLTTLDCFNLRLRASLVTLSGCQTGRSVVSGGDELLGLTRALLSAGAASLVLSLWAVEDISTARLMEAFYRNLAAGRPREKPCGRHSSASSAGKAQPTAPRPRATPIHTSGRPSSWWEIPARCSPECRSRSIPLLQ